ncbi:MAG: 2-hydroxyglutaryl-CoA dehydratase [Bacilli bacterium]|nr:2-hydroxyglutaryl-CoA dehydratase [Bacilli bacterium]
MYKLYMGLDIGSVTTKGVIIDNYDNIITSSYIYTEGNPVRAVKKVIKNMRSDIDLNKYEVVSIGTTGSGRKLIGKMLEASVIKNEIMATSLGTMRMYPDVSTIFEIGGQDSKIILIKDKIVSDYVMNSHCLSGTGSFIDTLAKRLKVDINDVGSIALRSNNKIDITGRCIVFAESDLINKIQNGYKKEDILAGVCHSIALSYINNIAKGKKIKLPIVFNGGVSKNIAVVKELEDITGEKIIVNNNSHLMGAFGIALMARDSGILRVFDFNIDNYDIETKITSCSNCSSNCSVILIYRNGDLIDHWGNKCNDIKELKKV